LGVDVLPWRFEPGGREEKEMRVEIEIGRNGKAIKGRKETKVTHSANRLDIKDPYFQNVWQRQRR